MAGTAPDLQDLRVKGYRVVELPRVSSSPRLVDEGAERIVFVVVWKRVVLVKGLHHLGNVLAAILGFAGPEEQGNSVLHRERVGALDTDQRIGRAL